MKGRSFWNSFWLWCWRRWFSWCKTYIKTDSRCCEVSVSFISMHFVYQFLFPVIGFGFEDLFVLILEDYICWFVLKFAQLSSLKLAVLSEFKTDVVYKLECTGCKPNSCRPKVSYHTTKVEEHRKAEHSLSSELERKIISPAISINNLLTIEALHIRKKKAGLNTRNLLVAWVGTDAVVRRIKKFG